MIWIFFFQQLGFEFGGVHGAMGVAVKTSMTLETSKANILGMC